MSWRTEPLRRAARCLAWPWLAAGLMLGAAVVAEEEEEGDGEEETPAGREGKPDAARPRADHGFEVAEMAFPENVTEGLSNAGSWVPVYVELKVTAGRTVQALLEGYLGEPRERVTLRQWVEVSPGAPRRAWLYLRVPPGEHVGNVHFEVKSAAGAVVSRAPPDWNVNAFGQEDRRRVAFLVAGRGSGNLLPWRDQVRIGGKALSAPAEGWPGKRLPDSVLGYSPFDVVVLQDLGDADLEPAQVEALRAWVHLGGFVVFAPQSLGGEVFRSRIAGEFFGDALEEEPKQVPGFKPGELFASGKGDLQDFRGRDPLLKPAKEVPLALLDPFRGNGAREVVALPHGSPAEGEEASRLYAEIPYGRGTVGLMTAHPPSGATLEEGTAILEVLAGVWKQVIEWHAGDASDHPARATANFQASDLEGLLHDASRDVGLPFITAVIGAYLLLVGPGLYFLLRRWNRLPAVVWVEPLLVVVYLGVIFATGYITKGVLTKTKLLTFISHAEGSPVALRSSYLTIFSAGEETYRIDCPRGALVNPVFFNEKEARPVVLSRSGKGGLSLEDYRLGHWEQGHVANWEVLDLAGSGLEIEALPSPPDAPRVKVTNRLAYPVLEGAVFRSRMEIPLQRIEPGQTVTAGAGESPAGGADARGAAAKNAGRSDEDLRPLRRAMLWYKRGRGRDLLAMALVDRGEADFQVDKRTSLKERFDVYFLHGER